MGDDVSFRWAINACLVGAALLLLPFARPVISAERPLIDGVPGFVVFAVAPVVDMVLGVLLDISNVLEIATRACKTHGARQYLLLERAAC